VVVDSTFDLSVRVDGISFRSCALPPTRGSASSESPTRAPDSPQQLLRLLFQRRIHLGFDCRFTRFHGGSNLLEETILLGGLGLESRQGLVELCDGNEGRRREEVGE
jgi:hypothetical protein